jgi:hypothetical protein
MKRTFSIITVLSYFLGVWHLSAYGQAGHTDLKSVIPQLKAFSANHVAEKAFLVIC